MGSPLTELRSAPHVKRDLSVERIMLNVVLALLPLLASWHAVKLRRVRHDRQEQDRLVEEQRATAESQVDRVQAAYAEVQQSTVALRGKVAELTSLREVALAASASLDPLEVVDRSLEAVTRHLNYDRAVVLLLDEARHALAGARSRGVTPEQAPSSGGSRSASTTPSRRFGNFRSLNNY